jgi:hypothetical protein
MSASQQHGKIFENHLKSAFPDSANNETHKSQWDIEKEYNKIDNLPISIKTTGSNNINLADARRFWLIDKPYKLLIGKYTQDGCMKNFHTLYEFCITEEEHTKFLGNITYSEIENFHNILSSYGKNLYVECRKYAKSNKKLFERRSIVQLNPKIDAKTQRRLQCSITFNSILKNIKNQTKYKDCYREINIKFSIKSSKRQFNI